MSLRILFVNDYSVEETLRNVRELGDNSAHLWGFDYLAKHENAEPIRTHKGFLSLQKRVYTDKIIGGLLEQIRICSKRREADVIVSANINIVWGLGYLKRFWKLPPVVAILHSMPQRSGRAYRAFMRSHLAGITRIACIARKDYQFLKNEIGLPPARLRHLPWSVNPTDFDLEDDPGFRRPATRYIVSIGKSKRDYQTLIDAFLKTGRTDLELRIHAAHASSRPKTTAANVRILNDFLPFRRCVTEYRHSEFIVIPLERSDRTLGLTSLFDAMAVGKPFILTRNPGVDLDIEKEGVGLWVNPGDVADLRIKMERLLHNPEEARRMGANGRRYLEERYNYSNFCRGLHELVKEAAHER